MTRSRTRTAVTAVALAAVLALGLPATPAAANPYTTPHVHSGAIDVFDSSNVYQDTLSMATVCQQSSSYTFSGGASGTYSATSSIVLDTTLLGDAYIIDIVFTHTGTYGSGSPKAIAGTTDLTLFLDPSAGSCTKASTDDCVITVGGVALSGVLADHGHGVNALTGGHWTAGGDYVLLTGTSTTFTILVGTGCPGPLSAINDGYVSLNLIWDDF